MEQESERIINFGWRLWFDAEDVMIFNARDDDAFKEEIGEKTVKAMNELEMSVGTTKINDWYRTKIDWDAIYECESKIEGLYRELLKETFGITQSYNEGHDGTALVGSCSAPLSIVKKIKDGGEYINHYNDSDRYVYTTDSGSLQSDLINKHLHRFDSCSIEFFAFEDEIEAAKEQNREKVA